LQRLVLLLRLLEKSGVLDGDHRLVGEDLQETDLSIGERAYPRASDDNHADGLACTNQRYGQYRAVSKASGIVAILRELFNFGLHSGDVNRSSVKDSTPVEKPTDQGNSIGDGHRPMVGDEAEPLTVHLTDRGVIGITKAGCALRDLCEHPPRVCRRT